MLKLIAPLALISAVAGFAPAQSIFFFKDNAENSLYRFNLDTDQVEAVSVFNNSDLVTGGRLYWEGAFPLYFVNVNGTSLRFFRQNTDNALPEPLVTGTLTSASVDGMLSKLDADHFAFGPVVINVANSTVTQYGTGAWFRDFSSHNANKIAAGVLQTLSLDTGAITNPALPPVTAAQAVEDFRLSATVDILHIAGTGIPFVHSDSLYNSDVSANSVADIALGRPLFGDGTKFVHQLFSNAPGVYTPGNSGNESGRSLSLLSTTTGVSLGSADSGAFENYCYWNGGVTFFSAHDSTRNEDGDIVDAYTVTSYDINLTPTVSHISVKAISNPARRGVGPNFPNGIRNVIASKDGRKVYLPGDDGIVVVDVATGDRVFHAAALNYHPYSADEAPSIDFNKLAPADAPKYLDFLTGKKKVPEALKVTADNNTDTTIDAGDLQGEVNLQNQELLKLPQ
ncbi:hypothetical protein BH09SUM1_BH09SUM1_22640 [soil metagenome]